MSKRKRVVFEQKDEEIYPKQLIISVIIKHDITRKVYEAWKTSMENRLVALHFRVVDKIVPSTRYIVVAKGASVESIQGWIDSATSSIQAPTDTIIVYNNWMIDMIKAQTVLGVEDYCVHFPVPQQTSYNNTAESTTYMQQDDAEDSQLSALSAGSVVPIFEHEKASASSSAAPTQVSVFDLPLSQEEALIAQNTIAIYNNRSTVNIQPKRHFLPSSQPAQPLPQQIVPATSASSSRPQNTANNTAKNGGMFAPHYRSYACMKSGDIKSGNLNKHITDTLDELQKIYELLDDNWRAKGYKTCIGILKQLQIKVTAIEQLDGIKGIGESIRTKINEILTTGALKKLQYFQDDPKITSLINLAKIWGVGEKTAAHFIKQGFHSIVDLRTPRGLNLLTFQQQIGLKYYEEFQSKIPRREVERIGEIVKVAVNALYPGAVCMICGSYRRGKPTSGDVDVIIAPPVDSGVEELPPETLSQVIDMLSEQGFLTDHLALPNQDRFGHNMSGTTGTSSSSVVSKFTAGSSGKNNRKRQKVSSSSSQYHANNNDSDDESEHSQHRDEVITVSDGQSQYNKHVRNQLAKARTSYMGVCRIPETNAIHRRIDMKVYPTSLFPFALLYFTGSDHFNRSMRLYAKKRGFHLSDKGLVYQEKVRFFPNVPYTIGELIPCRDEREIFDVLKLEYKEPVDRNVFDIDHLFPAEEDDETMMVATTANHRHGKMSSGFLKLTSGRDDDDDDEVVSDLEA